MKHSNSSGVPFHSVEPEAILKHRIIFMVLVGVFTALGTNWGALLSNPVEAIKPAADGADQLLSAGPALLPRFGMLLVIFFLVRFLIFRVLGAQISFLAPKQAGANNQPYMVTNFGYQPGNVKEYAEKYLDLILAGVLILIGFASGGIRF